MRNILITGANRGLGLEFVRQLAAGRFPETANVLAACREPEKSEELENIKETSTKIKVHLLKLDVTDEVDVNGILSKVENALGAKENLTVLINNAGYGVNLSLDDITKKEMDTFFAVNVTGPLMVTKALLPSLRKSTSHHKSPKVMNCYKAAVVNISTILGTFGHRPAFLSKGRDEHLKKLLPYKSSKAALNMCMHTLASTIGEEGVLVFLLHPEWVSTGMGGPDATFTPQESVADMLTVMTTRNQDHHGFIFNKKGELLPW